MAGAEFVRADLHVHTFPDNVPDPKPDVAAYVNAADERGLGVLGITDHNTVALVRPALKAAEGLNLLVLPGIEISTHDGHLLALFSPAGLAELETLANPIALKLEQISLTEQRSTRSMLDLIDEISRRGGLAIPAHVDASDGINEKLRPAELIEVLTHPGLAGLEFATKEALEGWFTDTDADPHRLAAWKARQNNRGLNERGLARIMSSDAHSIDKVGQDRSLRTLTRLRLDDANFEAVRNSIQFNPKARCKAEAVLPVSYPRVSRARFQGGFLDGVTLDFSSNLNCLIGGRGSGKSTALLAVRAALGAARGQDDEADQPGRMPDETVVDFVDSTGSERTAVRRRGEDPVEQSSGSPIRLRLADLGQDETGQLARGYEDAPELLLSFLDAFVVRHQYDEAEAGLLAALEENAAEVQRTAVQAEHVQKLEREHARLNATLQAARTGKIEEIAEWAALLAAQAPLLARLHAELSAAASLGPTAPPIDLDGLAREFGVDLTKRAKQFVEGPDGLGELLTEFERKRAEVRVAASASLAELAKPANEALDRWDADQADLVRRLADKQKELEAQGLSVQAGAVRQIAERLNGVKASLSELRAKTQAHELARRERQTLVQKLHANRDALFQARRFALKRIVDAANAYSDGLRIHVYFERSGMRELWVKWLSGEFLFRSPRVQRLAERLKPQELATRILSDVPGLLALSDDGGEAFFTADALDKARTWANIFLLETMRLEDRPRIGVQEAGVGEPKPFDKLSAGQQRSVLLSLLLCAERDEPLIIDQPEDHLDAQYIATAVVRHLERAKERRQVIIATHSANLTVLGDAELVIPLHVENRRGRPYDTGAVDRPSTRKQVCSLLEGGVEAYERRGQRYGFRFAGRPPDA